ncbi:hypothetical protein J8Y17_13150 [Bacillus cereus]|uniref:hypothetical protein n=1 Tax=Bacillus TaxID=1386 RepID=UPI0008FDD0A6|nr:MULTISPECIES: hypothetical protein [Bacillus]UBR32085.1 hypothetical protein LCG60_09465 [Bacillus sp. SD-4]AXO93333.1 hypothetical protein DY471_13385 [Bacillus anthracis]MBE3641602.1 hypothetical protein [Bacillus anthracis]MCX9098025.1 hypothetical protein [Bacillus anthracis]MDA1739941.1 hypothetical protein [Bacillus cereus]
MKSINVNGNIYYIESVPFEDKSEQDEEGYYEYFYKGVNLSFHSDKEIITARIYDKEKIIYFLKNPSPAFGKDFEAIKVYIIKEFDVNTFKILGGEKAYIEL